MSEWRLVGSNPPTKAGTYLVANTQEVGQARYKPRGERWVFPSAAMAFVVTHWQPMPSPPLSTFPSEAK